MVDLSLLSRGVDAAQVAVESQKATQQQVIPEAYVEPMSGLEELQASDIESSREWYAKLLDTQMDTTTKKYYKNSSKNIRDSLGLTDKLSDNVIEEYLDNGRLGDLDEIMLSNARAAWDEERTLRLDELLRMERPVPEKAQLLENFNKEQFPYSMDNIIKFRADAASKYIADKAAAEHNYNPQDPRNWEKESKELAGYKANVMSQLVTKYGQMREERSGWEGFKEFAVEAFPGMQFVRHLGLVQQLQEEGFIEDKNVAKDIASGVFSTITRDAIRKEVWAMPKEKFDRFVDFIEKSPVIASFGGGSQQPMAMQAFWADIINMTTGEKWASTGLDLLGVAGAAADAASGIKVSKRGVKAIGASTRTHSIFNEFDNYFNTGTSDEMKEAWKMFKKTPQGKQFEADISKMASDKARAKSFKEGMSSLEAKEFMDKFKASMEEGFLRAKAKTDIIDADFTVLKTEDVGDLGDIGRIPDIQKGEGESIGRAMLAGSDASVDNIAGARNSASIKYQKAFAEKAGQLSPDEMFALMAEVVAGGKRGTTPFLKAGMTGEDIAPNNLRPSVYYTREDLKKTFTYPGLETYDPTAFERISNAAYDAHEQTLSYFQSLPVDIKTAEMRQVAKGTGVAIEQVFGLGPKGDQPITSMTRKEIEDLVKGSDFQITEDSLGNIWLKREGYLSANGYWTPLEVKETESVIGGLLREAYHQLGSIEVTQPLANIQDIQYASSARAGILEQLTRQFNDSIKGTSKEQRNLAESLLKDEWNSNKTMNRDDLYLNANYDDKVVDIVDTVHEIDKTSGSFVNNALYEAKASQGYKTLDISSIDQNTLTKLKNLDMSIDLTGDLTAKKIDTPTVAQLNEDFVIDFKRGEVIKPNMSTAKLLEDSDVWRLDETVMVDGTDAVNYVVVPKTITVNPLNPQQIGYSTLAGWMYNAKAFIRYPIEGLMDSAGRRLKTTMKTVAAGRSFVDANQQVKGLKEFSKTFLNETLDEFAKNKMFEEIAIKYGMTSLNSVENFKRFLADNNLTRLPDNVDKLQVAPNTFNPFNLATLLDSEAGPSIVRNSARRFKRGDYSIKNLRVSAESSDLVPLNKFIHSIAKRAGQIGGVQNYLEVASNRFFARYKHLADPTKTPNNPLDFMQHFESYANPTAKENFLTDYTSAKRNAEEILRALDALDTEVLTNKRIIGNTVKKYLESDSVVKNGIGDLLMSANPGKRLIGLAYNSVFALDPSQATVQVSSIVMATALHPVHGMRAAAGYMPLRYLINVINRGGDLNKEASLLAEWPALKAYGARAGSLGAWGAQDLKALAQAAVRAGLKNIALDDIRGNNIFINPIGGAAKLGRVSKAPFNEGNLAARLLGLEIAASDRASKEGKKIYLFNDKDWKTVIAQADMYSGGISVANKRRLTDNPLIRPLAAMTSFQLKMFESVIGPTLFGEGKKSLVKRAYFIAAMLGLLGYNYLWDAEEAGKKALATQTVTGGAISADLARGGYLTAAISWMVGYKADLSRMSPQILSNFYVQLFNAVIGDKEAGVQDWAPFYVSFIRGLGDRTVNIGRILTDPDNADPAWAAMSPGEKAALVSKELIRISPGLSRAEKAFVAYKYNAYINRKGIDMIPDDYKRADLAKKALMSALFGIEAYEESGLGKYTRYSYAQDLLEDYKATSKYLTNRLTTARVFKREGNDEKYAEEMIRFEHEFTVMTEGWTSAQRIQLGTEVDKKSWENFDPNRSWYFKNMITREDEALLESEIDAIRGRIVMPNQKDLQEVEKNIFYIQEQE